MKCQKNSMFSAFVIRYTVNINKTQRKLYKKGEKV